MMRLYVTKSFQFQHGSETLSFREGKYYRPADKEFAEKLLEREEVLKISEDEDAKSNKLIDNKDRIKKAVTLDDARELLPIKPKAIPKKKGGKD